MNPRRVLLALDTAVALLGAGASSAGAFKGFESPTHNIGCVDRRDGHGFLLSRQSVKFF